MARRPFLCFAGPMELILVTGMSGAGRRSILSALEDSGCATLDNVPLRLLEPLLELEAKLNPTRPRLAVGLDNRYPGFASEFLPVLDRLGDGHIGLCLLFVEADDATLLRRFSESRRPHFLASREGSLTRAIARERELVAPLRKRSNAVLNTSRLTLSQLRQKLAELLPDLPAQGTALRLLSFGFKYGLPPEADMVWDARFLPNPHYVEELRPLTGRDEPVQRYLTSSEAFNAFLARMEDWMRWMWPMVHQEGRAYFTVAIGCTGGQHRSVALAELLGKRLHKDVPSLAVLHRELTGSTQ